VYKRQELFRIYQMADYLKITAAEAGEITVEEFLYWNAYEQLKQDKRDGSR
jgi:predicted nucleotide-binding protein (sugar kinase/HSP70/actin superfamily)